MERWERPPTSDQLTVRGSQKAEFIMTLNSKAKYAFPPLDLSQLKCAIGERVIVQDEVAGEVAGIVRGFEYWEEGNQRNRQPGFLWVVEVTECQFSTWIGETQFYEDQEVTGLGKLLTLPV